jgi:hypothetical protein
VTGSTISAAATAATRTIGRNRDQRGGDSRDEDDRQEPRSRTVRARFLDRLHDQRPGRDVPPADPGDDHPQDAGSEDEEHHVQLEE